MLQNPHSHSAYLQRSASSFIPGNEVGMSNKKVNRRRRQIQKPEWKVSDQPLKIINMTVQQEVILELPEHDFVERMIEAHTPEERSVYVHEVSERPVIERQLKTSEIEMRNVESRNPDMRSIEERASAERKIQAKHISSRKIRWKTPKGSGD